MKSAVCIGINYVGTDYELRGCINDADDWASLLGSQKFNAAILAEEQATKENILLAITHLVRSLAPGDVGVITYSGHGTWVPDQDGDEPDGRDEAVCPIDMGEDGRNLIIGPEFKAIFDQISHGARVVFITDSCFSGTVYRFFNGSSGTRKVRFLPPAHFLKEETLVRRMDLGFGQLQPHVNTVKPPLRGLIHFSGCGDNEYSNDANLDGRFNGAMTYYATRAFRQTLKEKGCYLDAWKRIRQSLPSWEYQQTPLLNATSDLKRVRLLS